MTRASLRLLAASLLTLLYGSCAVAQTRYEFRLDPDPPRNVVAGSGFFTVDDTAIPLLGAASVRATSFEGTIGTNDGRDLFAPFGYSRGSTVTTITFDGGSPTGEVVDVVRTPTNAVVSFQDHVPVGIDYVEQHSLTAFVPGCPSVCGSSEEVRMTGTNWSFVSRSFPGAGFDSGFGAIRFASPIPEPATVVLMLSGLGLVASAARRRRSMHAASAG